MVTENGQPQHLFRVSKLKRLYHQYRQDQRGRGQGLKEDSGSGIGTTNCPGDLEDASTIFSKRMIYKEGPRSTALFTISSSIPSTSTSLY